MLTENEKQKVLDKVNELHSLLKDMNLNSRINVDASNGNGERVLDMETDNGYWRSSTSVCMGYDVESWQPSVTYYDNSAWASSSDDC